MERKSLSLGFSLVELITVIILLGIIATVVLPRFSSRAGYVEYAVRDQIISSFRYAQQHAMYDHDGDCYRLNIDAGGFGPQREGVYIGPAGEVTFGGDYQGISLDPEAPVYFDGLGNTYIDDCDLTSLADEYEITINPSGLQLQIFSTGYVKAL